MATKGAKLAKTREGALYGAERALQTAGAEGTLLGKGAVLGGTGAVEGLLYNPAETGMSRKEGAVSTAAFGTALAMGGPLAKMALKGGFNVISGVNIANIDNLGTVHPDTMWWDYSIGSVKQRPFSEIWQDTTDPLMAGLKAAKRPLEGRCAQCQYLAICGGNSRTRAWQLTGNAWAEDPGCYLSDKEIGVVNMPQKVELTPYRRNRKVSDDQLVKTDF